MIDVVSKMATARGELLLFVRDILDDSSMKWLRELMSDINKDVVKEGNDDFAASVWPLYKNALRFFKEYCTEVTPAGILVTFYISAIELGVRSVGDYVESLPQFTDEVDMEDWDLMSMEYAVKYDMVACAMLTKKWVGMEDDVYLWAGGLHTMSALNLI